MQLTNRVVRAGACVVAAASLTMCATAPGPQAQVFEQLEIQPDFPGFNTAGT